MTKDYDHDKLIARFLRKLSEAAKDKGVVCGRLQENKPYISKQVAKGIEMNFVFHKNSPYHAVCADVVLLNPPGVVAEHTHTIDHKPLPTVIPSGDASTLKEISIGQN